MICELLTRDISQTQTAETTTEYSVFTIFTVSTDIIIHNSEDTSQHKLRHIANMIENTV